MFDLMVKHEWVEKLVMGICVLLLAIMIGFTASFLPDTDYTGTKTSTDEIAEDWVVCKMLGLPMILCLMDEE